MPVEFELRVIGPVAGHEFPAEPVEIPFVIQVALANTLVPGVANRLAPVCGQECQEVIFAFGAQKVHIQTRVQLMAEIAIDIEAGDQQVVDAFEHRVIDDPGGFRVVTDQSVVHRGAVHVAEYGQCGIRVAAVAVPDIAHRILDVQRIKIRHRTLFCLAVFAEQVTVMGPACKQPEVVFELGRRCQVVSDRIQKRVARGHDFGIRIKEDNPELVLDHVQRHLAAAHRALDETLDEELRIVEQEGVARFHRYRGEGLDRIRGDGRVVGRQANHIIVRLDEQLFVSLHTLVGQLVHEMGLGNDAALVACDAVVHRARWIAIRTPRRYDFDRLARRRGRAHQAVKLARVRGVKMQVRLEQVFIQVTPDEPFLVAGAVQKRLPLPDLAGGDLRWRLVFGHRRALREPVHQRGVFLPVEVRHRIGHAAPGMSGRVIVEFVDARAGLGTIEDDIEVIAEHAGARLRVQLLLAQHAVHDRVFQVGFRIDIAFVQHRMELFLAPFFGGLRIDEQPCRVGRRDTRTVIDLVLVTAAVDALGR